jgi:hypothetical protein
MICDAEKKAACSIETSDSAEGEFAVSIVAPFARVSKLADLSVPLRRPNRSAPLPTPTLQEELLAWEAASDEAWESIDAE